MKKVLFPFFALLLMAACQKETLQDDRSTQTQVAESRNDGNNLVTICHQLGNGEYNIIQVNQNAVPAHLAHGDKLVDADGDGYTAPDCCTGSMDDCNDNNANVNPGAGEVCGDNVDNNCNGETDEGCCNYSCFSQENLEGGSDWFFYYDSEINNCEEYSSFVQVNCPQFVAFAMEISPDFRAVYFYLLEGNIECYEYSYFGEGNLSQADFDCASALLRAYIAAHPEIPDYCDLYYPMSGDGSSNSARPEDLMKNLLPENLRKQLDKQ